MAKRDLGILPNPVNRDPRSEAALIFGTLADSIDQATAQQWLTTLASLVKNLEQRHGRRTPDASVVIGFGGKFFDRFPDLAANRPHGLTNVPALPTPAIAADFFLHVTYTVEAHYADFLKSLWATRPTLVSLDIEHGYARADRREVFGQLDGLRNLTSTQRRTHTTIDTAYLPEEPAWLKGGSYAAYLKIEQNLDTWATLTQETREQTIGRREADGSRLDLPTGSDPKAEGEFAAEGCPVSPASHLRKTGPRGAVNDTNLIFRRGHPYAEEDSGTMHFGLQFVSYQRSLVDFDVVLNRWMLNPNFPLPGTGADSLLTQGLISFLKSGVFVVPPHDDRFPAAGFFDQPRPPSTRRDARVHIRKSAQDVNGSPVMAEIGGLQFQLIDPASGQPIGTTVATDPAGRAVLPGGRVGQTVLVRELAGSKFQPLGDISVVLDRRDVIVPVINRLASLDTPPYP